MSEKLQEIDRCIGELKHIMNHYPTSSRLYVLAELAQKLLKEYRAVVENEELKKVRNRYIKHTEPKVYRCGVCPYEVTLKKT